MRAAVQTQAAPGKTNQPAMSKSSKAGDSKLRRRLSNSFQESITPKLAVICCVRCQPGRPCAGSNQGKSCQSPRVQRRSRRM